MAVNSQLLTQQNLQVFTSKKKKLKIKNNFYFWKMPLFFLKLYKKFLNFLTKQILIIRLVIKQNNIFLSCYSLKKTLQTKSATSFKIKISKRKLKTNSIYVLNKFFQLIEKKRKKFSQYNNNIVVSFNAPKYLRKHILRKFLINFKTKTILFNLLPKKSFNGCRVKKMRRRKYKKFRILK